MKRTPLRKIGRKGRRIKKEMDDIRPMLLERSRGVCEHCGKIPTHVYIPDRTVLEMHHKDHNRNNTTPENCIMLAPYCHDMYGYMPADWEGWPVNI